MNKAGDEQIKMKIAVSVLILTSCYYTFTYAKSLWVDDKNKLGGFGAGMAAMIGAVGLLILIYVRT